MTADTKLMTADDLWAMPKDGTHRYELVQGELVEMSPAGFDHSEIALLIGTSLLNFVRPRRLGKVCGADGGFIISRNPDTVLAPGGAFVAGAKKSAKFYPGPPDLAVEVVSPSDRYSEVEAKVSQYLAAGTRIVIVVDPGTQTARIATAAATRRLTIDDAIDGGDVLPGWSLPLRDLFAD